MCGYVAVDIEKSIHSDEYYLLALPYSNWSETSWAAAIAATWQLLMEIQPPSVAVSFL